LTTCVGSVRLSGRARITHPSDTDEGLNQAMDKRASSAARPHWLELEVTDNDIERSLLACIQAAARLYKKEVLLPVAQRSLNYLLNKEMVRAACWRDLR